MESRCTGDEEAGGVREREPMEAGLGGGQHWKSQPKRNEKEQKIKKMIAAIRTYTIFNATCSENWQKLQ